MLEALTKYGGIDVTTDAPGNSSESWAQGEALWTLMLIHCSYTDPPPPPPPPHLSYSPGIYGYDGETKPAAPKKGSRFGKAKAALASKKQPTKVAAEKSPVEKDAAAAKKTAEKKSKNAAKKTAEKKPKKISKKAKSLDATPAKISFRSTSKSASTFTPTGKPIATVAAEAEQATAEQLLASAQETVSAACTTLTKQEEELVVAELELDHIVEQVRVLCCAPSSTLSLSLTCSLITFAD